MRALLLLVILTTSFNSFSSDTKCLDAHIEQAYEKSNQDTFLNRYMRPGWKHGYWKFMGTTWAIGGYASTMAIGGVFGTVGVYFLTRSSVASIQEPKYQFLKDYLDYAEHKSNLKMKQIKHKHKKIYAKALKKTGLAPSDLNIELYVGMSGGEFCHEDGSPFSFNKMIRTIKKKPVITFL